MAQQTVADVMTPEPTTIGMSETLETAARTMAAQDVGALVVQAGTTTVGIVTDRDLVVRGLAEGLGLEAMVGEVASEDLISVGPDVPVEVAVELMRAAAVRRIPVMDDDVPIGIVSIGDLAAERDPMSALADISEAQPNA
ncbi:CBS domain-containing protein [Promicromonospora umidemergens]|uniref:CBS domain-containing protein n=1 Tax=Promicromonospora umidemergens TaxID=629679 RepID=A0ABP8XYD4_9MICO|nr:CBS domain-containing protein [Promicromonospora umidemergens]MCP2284158.1 CBS domain-containing protein [Promicromonospora umidemergens]